MSFEGAGVVTAVGRREQAGPCRHWDLLSRSGLAPSANHSTKKRLSLPFCFRAWASLVLRPQDGNLHPVNSAPTQSCWPLTLTVTLADLAAARAADDRELCPISAADWI